MPLLRYLNPDSYAVANLAFFPATKFSFATAILSFLEVSKLAQYSND